MLRKYSYLAITGVLLLSTTAFGANTVDPCNGTERPDLYQKAVDGAESSARGEVANTTDALNKATVKDTLKNCLDKYKNFSINGLFGIGDLDFDGLLDDAAKAACDAVDSAYDSTVRSINNKTDSVLPGGIGVEAGATLPNSGGLESGNSGSLINIEEKDINQSASQGTSRIINNEIRNAGREASGISKDVIKEVDTDVPNVFGSGVFK